MTAHAGADARHLLEPLLEAAGDSVSAVILFGSQLVRANPDRHSAWDFVVVVEDYGRFHRSLHRAGHLIRKPWLLNALARVLSPSITAFSPFDEGVPVAKLAIVDGPAFARSLSSDSRDHFLKGRMVQRVEVIWARDERVRAEVEGRLAAARRRVLDWAGPWLTEPITPLSLAREMLQVSYGGEVRPESRDRVLEVVEVQQDWLEEAYRQVLRAAEADGEVVPVDAGDAPAWRWSRPPGTFRTLRIRGYFLRSKIRATVRWAKHIVTFNDWLTYIQRKAERRIGMEIEISDRARRWPLVFLWPTVFRVLRARGDTDPS